MQTKTYFANSVPAAIEAARKELGEDALLVNSKPAPAAARPFGRLEVTFAYEAPAASKVPSYEVAREVAREERRPVSDLDEIRQQLHALRTAMGQAGPGVAISHAPQNDNRFGETRLRDSGLEPDTAQEVSEAASRRPGDRHAALVQELAGRISCSPFKEMAAGESRALAFVGPAGRGKTTSLIKVALRYGLTKRIPVRIYAAGSHGVGCQEQMARYASILGVPFQACESLESLNLALNGEIWKGLALIDTPGLSASDRGGISEFARFFSRRPEIERHLVLRADSHSADMSHMISRFSGVEPGRLLFTGMDEAISLGAMVNTLIRSGIPATFAGTGQEIPDDLEELDAMSLARRISGQKAITAMAA
jgi:flagellar biosynthesis GTPase FlhF